MLGLLSRRGMTEGRREGIERSYGGLRSRSRSEREELSCQCRGGVRPWVLVSRI